MLKTTLIWTHRWLALVLLPLFAVIIITGAILALEPIVKDVASGPVADEPLEVATLVGFLAQVDPNGHSRSVHLEHPDRVVIEFSPRQQREVFAMTCPAAGSWKSGPSVPIFSAPSGSCTST